MNWRDWRDSLIASGSGNGLVLTRSRIRTAYAVAVLTDVLQFALGPVGWAFADEILDVIALVATTKLLGFHPLLLPSFLLELVPVIDVLPTWTGCVALVVAMRKKQANTADTGDAQPVTIDVKPTSVS